MFNPKLPVKTVKHHSAIFLSDIHLGNKDCKAEHLLDFLKYNKCDKLYLVGDIVDMWQMTKQFHWPALHNEILHTFIRLSQNGTEVIYLPGNHDEPIQKYSGVDIGNISIQREVIHVTKKNEQFVVLHGDQFDGEVTLGKFHSWIGDKAYDALLWANRLHSKYQKLRKGQYWSLAGYIKTRINGANKAIYRYKVACCDYADKKRLDGIICGHIHHPEDDLLGGVRYINDGDWIENCSALIEDESGNLKLVDWALEVRERDYAVEDLTEKLNKKAA